MTPQPYITDEEIEAARIAFLKEAGGMFPDASIPVWMLIAKAPFLKAIEAALEKRATVTAG